MKIKTFYISTCDKNNFILKYFIFFFRKYAGKNFNLKILGFNKPKIKFEKNIEFISLGKYQKNGAKGWTNYLIKYFSKIKDENIIFGLDDFLIARPINFKVLENCFLAVSPEIGRIDLQPMQYARKKYLFKFHKKINGVNFYELKKYYFWEQTYGISAAFSIWNRKWFLKYLEKNMSPWEWELKSSKKVRFDKKKILCSWDQFAIKKVEMLSDGAWPGFLNTNGLRKADISSIKKIQRKSDRVKKFKAISGIRSGYEELAGKNWINKIFGK